MAGYLGASPVPQTIQKKQSFTATASQTTFTTTGYTDGAFINVYLNGVRLINGTDYTATNGSDIVLTTGASASDVLDFETFNEFTLVDQTLETPTFRTSATLKNDTEEDTDGGRESTLIFKGEQSGGEISTLAEIEASHDGTADDEKGDLIFRTNDGSDGSSPTEAARIDSGQNLLVGTTSTTVYTSGSGGDAGVNLRADGQISNSSNSASVFNRMASDGPINLFYKDGSEGGRIGTDSNGDFVIDGSANHSGLRFKDNSVVPKQNGSDADNAIDLGKSDKRWKDLYLSGGAYLGGTGASNKLEDYETGTWTPYVEGASTAGTGSYAGQNGSYVKVGSLVTLNFDYTLNSHTGSGYLRLKGLPFQATSETGIEAIGTVMVNNFNTSASLGTLVLYLGTGNNQMRLYLSNDNTGWVQQNIDTAHALIGTITYRTDS